MLEYRHRHSHFEDQARTTQAGFAWTDGNHEGKSKCWLSGLPADQRSKHKLQKAQQMCWSMFKIGSVALIVKSSLHLLLFIAWNSGAAKMCAQPQNIDLY